MATTPKTRAEGLANRLCLKKNQGMLFVFKEELFATFWMKDTLIPLSIAFFDQSKSLIEVQDMPINSYPLKNYRCKKPFQYALEVPLGSFQIEKLRAGTKFSFLD